MKCPQCGQWNRASFPRCMKCGAELPVQTAEERKQTAPKMPEGGAAKVYIQIDDTGKATSTEDSRDKLAREMKDLAARKRRGEEEQRKLRANSARQGFVPSARIAQTLNGRETFPVQQYTSYTRDGVEVEGIVRPDAIPVSSSRVIGYDEAALPEPGMGVVIRTNAAGLAEEVLKGEFETLAERAGSLLKRARAAAGGSLLQKQPSLYMKLARELPKDQLQEIVTDSPDIFLEMQEYFTYMGDRENLEKLRLYEDDYSLYKLYRFDTHYQRALSRYVPLKSGGSLVIEQTEAMVVIDVNTGAAIKGKQERKSIFPQMNREAALEIARQIRLRSLSGMILIDFINLKEEEEKRELLQYLRKCTVEDRAWVQVVDITGLGIVEMTRNKQWRSLAEQVPADFFSDNPR